MKLNAAAGYYRVSVARDDMKAPQIYEEEIRRYCSYRGIELGPVFSDIEIHPPAVGRFALRP